MRREELHDSVAAVHEERRENDLKQLLKLKQIWKLHRKIDCTLHPVWQQGLRCINIPDISATPGGMGNPNEPN